jgi:hypothetical protein
MIVATLRYKGMTLELRDDGVWVCEDETFQTYLNSAFSTVLYPPSPTAGVYEVLDQARAVSRRFGVAYEVTPTTQEPPPTDRVY